MNIKKIDGMSYNHEDGWAYHVNSTRYYSLSDALNGMKIPAYERSLILEFDTKLHNASIHQANDYGTEFKKAEPLLSRARNLRYELQTIDGRYIELLDSIAKKGLARA